MEKQDSRRVSIEERRILRKTAIGLLSQGKKKKEVAQLIGVRPNTITCWVKQYEEKGSKGFLEKKRGVKSADKKILSDEQEREIQKMITDTMPDQLRLDFALWTRKAVKELIARELGINLGLTTTGDYLRKWGFTPQKPKKRAYEQSPKKVEKWLDEEYPAIKQRAKTEGAEIHWGDETGIKNSCNHGRSYAPKGKTPVKSGMSKRFSINMISTITNQGKVQFMIYSDTMNADKLIEFMQQLIKASDKKVFLILDNLRVHHSKVVKAWLEKVEIKKYIEIFFLPSYSPERNPDEYLNCDLKQGISNKQSPKSKEKLQANVQQHMEMLQQNPARVEKYFQHESIKYAA